MKIQAAYKTVLLCVFLLATVGVFAGDDPDTEKTKTYTKTYSLQPGDGVSVTNQFGDVRISTWNKNEVKVDVTISARSSSEERAQEILDNIEIEAGKSPGGVWFKTEMANKGVKGKSNNQYKNEGFSIHYTVSMPSANALKIQNSFGSTYVPDMNGEADITSKFGSLEAGNLPKVKSILVEFGSAEIKSIHDGKLVIKFSSAVVHKLTGSVNAVLEHSNSVKMGVDNSISDLNVKNNFSTLYLDVSKNLGARFEIQTHFGDFSNQSSFAINQENEDSEQRGPRFDHKYSGSNGNGQVKMKIRSEFGKVIVGHNLPMNLEKKEKDRKQTRTV